MIDCPQCGSHVDGYTCPTCGASDLTLGPIVRPEVMATRERYLASAPKPDRPMKREEARAILVQFGRRTGNHPRAWATRILERIEQGERLPPISQQYAREVAAPSPSVEILAIPPPVA